jgi:hypothetical protein
MKTVALASRRIAGIEDVLAFAKPEFFFHRYLSA